jgi:hypothetical protein
MIRLCCPVRSLSPRLAILPTRAHSCYLVHSHRSARLRRSLPCPRTTYCSSPFLFASGSGTGYPGRGQCAVCPALRILCQKYYRGHAAGSASKSKSDRAVFYGIQTLVASVPAHSSDPDPSLLLPAAGEEHELVHSARRNRQGCSHWRKRNQSHNHSRTQIRRQQRAPSGLGPHLRRCRGLVPVALPQLPSMLARTLLLSPCQPWTVLLSGPIPAMFPYSRMLAFGSQPRGILVAGV